MSQPGRRPGTAVGDERHFIEQTRTNMSQLVRRPGTAVGDERHILKALWSRKGIYTLQGGLWVCAMPALVLDELD